MLTALSILGVLVVLFLVAALATRDSEALAPAPPDAADLDLPSPVTPDAVRGLRFGLAVRGYKMAEVDAALDRLAADLEDRDRQIASLTTPDAPDAAPDAAPEVPATDAAFGAAAPVEVPVPVEPVQPAVPVEPATPVEPAAPVEPVAPVEPLAPVEPAAPVDPTAPVAVPEPAQPLPVADPVPAEPLTPADDPAPLEPAARGGSIAFPLDFPAVEPADEAGYLADVPPADGLPHDDAGSSQLRTP